MPSILASLSPADLAILFEPDPYSYDSTVTDPSQPPSLFVQVMREEEDKFFAAFPEAKKAAEYRQRRRAQLRALLYADAQGPPLVHHDPYCPPRQCPLAEEPPAPTPQQQQLPHSPTLHDRHPHQGEHHSGSQHITSDKPTSTISRDRGADRAPKSRSRSPTPKPSRTPRPRSNKPKPKPKRRVGPLPGKRPRKQHLDGRKPTLACLFCRGRKIACGAPLPGSIGKTCNQCQRRSLRCEFPAESRRGMRQRKALNDSDDDQSVILGESILSL